MDIQALQFLKCGTTTAEHFGFRHLDTFKKHPECVACPKKIDYTVPAQEKKMDAMGGMLASGTQHFIDSKMHAITEPSLFYSLEQVPRTGDVALALHIYNVERSIAESILIHTLRSLASDLGCQNTVVRINSLGDRDSSARYIRELTNFFRKRLEEMPEPARELMKEHVFNALSYLIEKDHELAYRSPNPLEYLSDQSRRHFRDIVEYLDMSETPYEIDPKLIGHHLFYTDALFSVDMYVNSIRDTAHPLIIRGGRYTEFVHRNTKRIIPAVGAVAILKNKRSPAKVPKSANLKPTVSIIQLGFGPKIRSLMLIESLRRAGISVHQNLASDSLSAQLRTAETMNIPQVVIIGQKEFVEGTVILRDMKARNQENIPFAQVVQKLRRTLTTA